MIVNFVAAHPMAAGFLEGPALWFGNRGTGFVLLMLLTLSTVLGVLSTARLSLRRWPRMLSQGLHRNVSLLAVTFLAAHVATAVVDTFLMYRSLRKKLAAKFGDEAAATKGNGMYSAMRAFQMRRSRLPRPQVDRASPTFLAVFKRK